MTLEPDACQNITVMVMQRQARIELKALGLKESALDNILIVPKVVVFARHMVDVDREGKLEHETQRLPQSRVGKARNAIKEKLKIFGFVRGFATSTARSDIIFLEELIRRNGSPVIVMPFPKEDFLKTSVPGEWAKLLKRTHAKLDIKLL